MSKTPKYTLMKEKEFTMIKALLTAGLSRTKVMEVTGRSYPTVKYIEQSTSFENYRKIVHDANSKTNAKKEEPAQTQAPAAYPNELIDVLQNILEGQQQILDSLDKIVIPKRRFGV